LFYADDGWTIKAVMAADMERARQLAEREFAAGSTIRVHRDSDLLPVIFHDDGHEVREETIAAVYARIVTAIDTQGWGPEDPGLGIITDAGEQLSVVFGTRAHAQEIADDLSENLTPDYYL